MGNGSGESLYLTSSPVLSSASMERRESACGRLLGMLRSVVAFSGRACYELSTYWGRWLFCYVFGKNASVHAWQRQIGAARTYEEWREAALELDKAVGNERWKEDPASDDYDYELVQMRLEQLRMAKESHDTESLVFLLRASLSRSFGEIGNELLYCQSNIGTKRLIEEYTEELISALELLYAALPETTRGERREKTELFRSFRHMLGNTALVLSGGASLGTNHLGVLKALNGAGLLPRIIAGSSSGAIMASMLCTRKDEQLEGLFSLAGEDAGDGISLNFVDEPTATGTRAVLGKVRRIVKEGVLFDQDILRSCMRANLGDTTFLEAFRASKRILCVTVSSSTRHELPRLLNYLTAPNVVVWSAVVASCAVPGVFASSALLAKDPGSGALVPWSLGEARWIDGSVENDIPQRALAELFNVNHCIVSQVNPHVVPFLRRCRRRGRRGMLDRLLDAVLFLVHSEACFRLEQLESLGVASQTCHHLLSVLRQRYSGDITIVPDVTWQDVRLMLTDPSRASLAASVARGERATWPALSAVWNQCKAELVLDQLLSRLGKGESDPDPDAERSGSRRPASPLVYRTLESSFSLSFSLDTVSAASDEGGGGSGGSGGGERDASKTRLC